MTKIQLKRSSALLSGSARTPAANQLDYGELAVNYSTTDPQLFYKDSGGNVVSFFEPYAALAGATFTGDVNFNTDVDFDGAVTIKGDSTNGSGKLTLTCENNTHSVNIKAPAHSAAANYTLTLPTTTGTSGNVLTTDGSGGLSWALSSMSNADAAKLAGIEAGATADQTAAEILTAIKTVDGAASGLDSDLLDGQEGSHYLDYNNFTNTPTIPTVPTNNNQLTNGAGYITSADGGNAGTLDGIDSSQFLRSDTSDTFTGTLSITGSINNSSTGGSSGAILGNLEVGYGAAYNSISARSNNALHLNYNSTGTVYVGVNNTVWHSGNDGSGSGLDADNLDGHDWNSTTKNVNGYDITASNWLRNDAAGEGLYNNVTGKHFFSAGTNYWHLDSTNGLILYDGYNGSAGSATNRKGYLYRDSNGFGLLNSNGYWFVNSPHGSTTSNILVVGGNPSQNHYNSVSTVRMSFGGGNDFTNYHFGINSENFGGYYTKLDLRWHTGIRMGAQQSYGGIRIYNNEDLSTTLVHFNSTPSGHTKHHQWIEFSNHGLYNPTNGAHLYTNTTSSYSPWIITGHRNNYTGILFNYNGRKISVGMFDSSGNGGTYSEVNGRWHTYYHHANTCLGVNSSSTSSSYGLYVTGAIYSTDNITAYSDGRKKTNVTTITSALSKVLNLRGVTYNKIENDKSVNEKTEMGVIAQEVEKVVPEVVTYAEDIDQYGVSYGNLTALLIEAVKELKIELNELKESLA